MGDDRGYSTPKAVCSVSVVVNLQFSKSGNERKRRVQFVVKQANKNTPTKHKKLIWPGKMFDLSRTMKQTWRKRQNSHSTLKSKPAMT